MNLLANEGIEQSYLSTGKVVQVSDTIKNYNIDSVIVNTDTVAVIADSISINKDSVYIAYDDLRIVNSKLIELNYQKDINNKLCNIINNDSITIQNYKELNDRINNDYKVAIAQRNIIAGVGILFFIISVILCVK